MRRKIKTIEHLHEYVESLISDGVVSRDDVISKCERILKTNERDTFNSYIKEARTTFSVRFADKFNSMTPQYRVILEDLLIAYDQMYEKLLTL